MKASEAILETLYDLEGTAFVHDPEATRMGIVQTEYDEYRRTQKLSQRSVEFITEPEAIAIYDKKFWTPMRCAELPNGADFALFQFGVNVGTRTAIKRLQKVVGEVSDGAIGPKTIAAARAYKGDLADAIFDEQDKYYDEIYAKNPARNGIYINGWHNRVRKARIWLATGFTQTGLFAGGFGFLLLVVSIFILTSRFFK